MNTKKSTIYFDPRLHRALQKKAFQSDRTISALVNEAVEIQFYEDAIDLKAIKERSSEPNLDFKQVIKNLRAGGQL